jgi:hypothetical protein
VLKYTDAMTKTVTVPDEVFAELKGCFDEREVVEIVAVISTTSRSSKHPFSSAKTSSGTVTVLVMASVLLLQLRLIIVLVGFWWRWMLARRTTCTEL